MTANAPKPITTRKSCLRVSDVVAGGSPLRNIGNASETSFGVSL